MHLVYVQNVLYPFHLMVIFFLLAMLVFIILIVLSVNSVLSSFVIYNISPHMLTEEYLALNFYGIYELFIYIVLNEFI